MEYLSGSKHYAAPDMRLVSLRYEDLVQDLEIEVISWLCTVCTQHASRGGVAPLWQDGKGRD